MATREVVLTGIIPAGVGGLIDLPSPLEGKIIAIVRHWPNGCNGLVDMALGHATTWMMPNLVDRFLALNDATITVPNIDEHVHAQEQLWMRVRNRDGGNAHTITATFVIEGK